jgi:hypothetical protein
MYIARSVKLYTSLEALLSFCLGNFRGSNVGVADGTDVSSMRSRWVQVQWYIYIYIYIYINVSYIFVKALKFDMRIHLQTNTHTHTQQIYDVFHKNPFVLLK